VVNWRWCWNRPFKRARIPRVSRGTLTILHAPPDVYGQDDERNCDDISVNRLPIVPEIPSHMGRISIDAPRHAQFTQEMHWKEGRIERPYRQPKVPLTQPFIKHPPSNLGPIHIERTQNSEQRPKAENVVKMSDDDVAVGLFEVD